MGPVSTSVNCHSHSQVDFKMHRERYKRKTVQSIRVYYELPYCSKVLYLLSSLEKAVILEMKISENSPKKVGVKMKEVMLQTQKYTATLFWKRKTSAKHPSKAAVIQR